MIQAIETHYKGYRFRSRLEARWAVFFDALGLEWEYEKEGFDLGSAGLYLPDFWVSTWRTWIEIKPSEPERGYLIKPTAFAWSSPEKRLLLICGNPWIGEHSIELLQHPNESLSLQEFVVCRRCDGIVLYAVDSGWVEIGPHTCGNHDKWPISGSLEHAYRAARSARFEHGEKPFTPPVFTVRVTPSLPYQVGSTVQHDEYGVGVVTHIESQRGSERRTKIRFPGHPEKTFVTDKVKLRVLTTPSS